METVLKEWALYCAIFPDKPRIKEIHLGGGTPTFFSAENLQKLINGILAKAEKCEEFELPHSAKLADLRDAILAGGKITLCTQCAVRRGINDGDQIPGIVIAGAASFVEEIMQPGVQALVY